MAFLAAAQPAPGNNLVMNALAKRWDDGMPLGNGWLGALIWQKDNQLRLSLDRVDLWDDRPMPEIGKLRFAWVHQQVEKNQYDTVQKIGDDPYETYPAPTKIPGAALEFDLDKLGHVVRNSLDIQTALNEITFDNGLVFKTYVHAVDELGYFSIQNCTQDITPVIKIPGYNSGAAGKQGSSVEGQGLEKLGYPQGMVETGDHFIRYHQPTWNGHYYEVLVQWIQSAGSITGQWTISNNKKAVLPSIEKRTAATIPGWDTHIAWWNDYWHRSAISIPDTLLLKQYYLDMYKFGCVARSHTPPISLQAIWTADNGNLPPWKGDLHHDLNTELSYWPGYTSNHLDLTASFTNWLWKVAPENKRWTKQYFGVNGINVPGVTTISGKPMGGWIQYSMSLTTAAWMAQHFYWQWKYGMDQQFLKERCLPYFKEVNKYFSAIRMKDDQGQYQLPLSSTPEYNDNGINAWFKSFTNYDLALVKSFNKEYNNLLNSNKKPGQKPALVITDLYPSFDTNTTGLTLAKGQNLDASHRHHAHLMAVYPLGLLTAGKDKTVMDKSLRWLEKTGTRGWCGYSFSWAACIYARANEGDHALAMLQAFANNFVSVNSFHLNGDQKGGQYSGFTYRPFTLEGNFAFAQGIHEMLLRSSNGYIEVFPALPAVWQNVSFTTLRTEGAYLVSATKANGAISAITITAAAGGLMQLQLPFNNFSISTEKNKYTIQEGILKLPMQKGSTVTIKNTR